MDTQDTLNAEFYMNAGIAKYNCGDFLGAITEFTKAITLPPEGWSYFSRGESYMMLGKLSEAHADFELAIAQGYHVSQMMLNRCK
jgi:tetratricopeptide (TPR) repeat protein